MVLELMDSKSTARSVKIPTSLESESTTSNPDTSFSFIKSIASSIDRNVLSEATWNGNKL